MRKKHDVLVLNKSWAPIHIIDFKRAISLVYQEKVVSLDHEMIHYNLTDWVEFSRLCEDKDYYKVKSISMDIAIPEIIVSTTFKRLPSRKVKYSRQNVFTRDGHICAYCGKKFKHKELTIDHIIPRSQGGMTKWDNVVGACFPCNQLKADRTPAQANMRLMYKPHKPKWESPLDGVSKGHPCKSWHHFMSRVSIE